MVSRLGPLVGWTPDGEIVVAKGIFTAKGTFYALRNACPHQSGPLCRRQIRGLLQASDQALAFVAQAAQFVERGRIAFADEIAVARE